METQTGHMGSKTPPKNKQTNLNRSPDKLASIPRLRKHSRSIKQNRPHKTTCHIFHRKRYLRNGRSNQKSLQTNSRKHSLCHELRRHRLLRSQRTLRLRRQGSRSSPSQTNLTLWQSNPPKWNKYRQISAEVNPRVLRQRRPSRVQKSGGREILSRQRRLRIHCYAEIGRQKNASRIHLPWNVVHPQHHERPSSNKNILQILTRAIPLKNSTNTENSL